LAIIYRFKIKYPPTNTTSHRAMNTKNKNFAMPAAVPAIPVKPNIPATTAISRKAKDHFNISYPLFLISDNYYKRQPIKRRLKIYYKIVRKKPASARALLEHHWFYQKIKKPSPIREEGFCNKENKWWRCRGLSGSTINVVYLQRFSKNSVEKS